MRNLIPNRVVVMKASVAIAVVLVTCTEALSAQSHHGSGISGGILGEAVRAEFIREHFGPPDSVRFVAAVLWRGSSDWGLNHDAAETARARAMMDSARRDAIRRRVQAGGTITVAANAWVEYDDRARTVSVLQRTYAVPTRDSARVLLVDRVDHVGGEPVVASIVVACPTEPDATNVPDTSGRRDIIADMQRMRDHWQACLLGNSVVRAFVERR